MSAFNRLNHLKELTTPVIDDNAGTISVTFTFDELHAFSEHVDWCIYEQDQPVNENLQSFICLLYTSPSPRDATLSRMPSSA